LIEIRLALVAGQLARSLFPNTAQTVEWVEVKNAIARQTLSFFVRTQMG
jgi:hypothetical protein